ncbi:mitochondrial substrate carrier family protein, partial [Striga asiatica]
MEKVQLVNLLWQIVCWRRRDCPAPAAFMRWRVDRWRTMLGKMGPTLSKWWRDKSGDREWDDNKPDISPHNCGLLSSYLNTIITSRTENLKQSKYSHLVISIVWRQVSTNVSNTGPGGVISGVQKHVPLETTFHVPSQGFRQLSAQNYPTPAKSLVERKQIIRHYTLRIPTEIVIPLVVVLTKHVDHIEIESSSPITTHLKSSSLSSTNSTSLTTSIIPCTILWARILVLLNAVGRGGVGPGQEVGPRGFVEEDEAMGGVGPPPRLDVRFSVGPGLFGGEQAEHEVAEIGRLSFGAAGWGELEGREMRLLFGYEIVMKPRAIPINIMSSSCVWHWLQILISTLV